MDPQQGHSFPQGGAAHGSVETRPSAEHLQTFAQHALDAFAQQSRGLAPQDINIFKDHLELLMKDCSQANIQAGKNWVVHHCQNPLQYDLLARAMVAIAISRQTFNDKLHIIYLTNDILSHCERKQQQWIKDAIYPHLVALLRVAYFFPGVDDSQRQRVTKVLDIWRSKEFFPRHVVNAMEMNVTQPPLLPTPPVPTGGPGSTNLPGGQGSGVHSGHWQPQSVSHPPPHQHQHPYPQQPQQQHPSRPHSMHQQQPPLHTGPWPHINPHMAGPHNPYLPHTAPVPPSAVQPIHPSALQPMPQGINPTFPMQQQPPYLQHQQPLHTLQQQHQAVNHGGRHLPQPVPASLPPPPPPAPTHRDVLTRDLPAGRMMSKIEPDAEYYETMSAYVSVPLQQDNTKREAMLAMVDEFVAENNMSLKSEDISKSNEGWHEGYLNEFYQTVAKRRKRAFSKNPESSRDGRGRDRANDSRAKERRRSVSRSRSRSRAKNRSRTRSRTPSRSRRRSRSYSRSISRSHSHSRSRGRSPGYRRRVVGSRERDGSRSRSRSRGRSWNKQYGRSRSRNRSRSHSRDRDVKRREMEDVFPARSFAGLGSRGGASSTASRPSFQPARHP